MSLRVGRPRWRGCRCCTSLVRSLDDLLNAMELAARPHEELSSESGSGGRGGYAAQLEPELSELAKDVQSGFTYVAGCIHRWRFDVEPEGIHIENAISKLDAKLLEIRPTALQFVQADVLRTYAVQLHLKQLARVLRAARVETREAVG